MIHLMIDKILSVNRLLPMAKNAKNKPTTLFLFDLHTNIRSLNMKRGQVDHQDNSDDSKETGLKDFLDGNLLPD